MVDLNVTHKAYRPKCIDILVINKNDELNFQPCLYFFKFTKPKMEKLLKILPLIIFIFCFNSFCCQNDSLPKRKSQFLIYANIGCPVYNKFNIAQYSYGTETTYWVKSKLKPLYVAGFEYSYKKFNIGLTGSYIQNEFTGNNFEYNVLGYNGHNAPQTIAVYNLYQKLITNQFQVSLNLGAKINLAPKHILYTNIFIASNLYYKNTVSNYYSSNQLGYDTAKYTLVKNGTTSQNPGKWPVFGFIVAYDYKITNRIMVDFKIITQLFFTNYQNDSYNIKQDGLLNGIADTRDAYVIKKNIFIAPTLGLKYKLF